MVSEKMIKELQEIIKSDYDADLSFAEITKIANDLVESFDVLAKIDWLDQKTLTNKSQCFK